MTKVDLPSLMMVITFLTNTVVGFYDPIRTPIARETGMAVFAAGSLFFIYVLIYLRSGFFGETEPRLNRLVMKGPYRFCRHPQYLSFIIMLFGFDLMLRSILRVVLTLTLSIPSVVYRGGTEDRLLMVRFGAEWERWAEKTGFLFPWIGRLKSTRSSLSQD